MRPYYAPPPPSKLGGGGGGGLFFLQKYQLSRDPPKTSLSKKVKVSELFKLEI